MEGGTRLVDRHPAPGAGGDVVMSAENITKVFPGTVALDGVTYEVQRGMVNVLVGENGAGKSTLMKILGGVEQPTEGRILLEGEEVHLLSPLDASANGIAAHTSRARGLSSHSTSEATSSGETCLPTRD